MEGEAAWGRMGKPWPALSLEGRDGHGAPGAGEKKRWTPLGIPDFWLKSAWMVVEQGYRDAGDRERYKV